MNTIDFSKANVGDEFFIVCGQNARQLPCIKKSKITFLEKNNDNSKKKVVFGDDKITMVYFKNSPSNRFFADSIGYIFYYVANNKKDAIDLLKQRVERAIELETDVVLKYTDRVNTMLKIKQEILTNDYKI